MEASTLLSLAVLPAQAQSPAPITHEGDVIRHLEFSADSQRILSCGGDTARIWDVKTGELLFDVNPTLHESAPIGSGPLEFCEWGEDETIVITEYNLGPHSFLTMEWDAHTGELLNSTIRRLDSIAGTTPDPFWPAQATLGERVVTWESMETCYDACAPGAILTEPSGSILRLAEDERIKQAFWSPSGRQLGIATLDSFDTVLSTVGFWSVDPESETYGHKLFEVEVPYLIWQVQWTQAEDSFFVYSDTEYRLPHTGQQGADEMLHYFDAAGHLLWRQELLPEHFYMRHIRFTDEDSAILLFSTAFNQRTGLLQTISVLDGAVINEVQSDRRSLGNPAYLYDTTEEQITLWNVENMHETVLTPTGGIGQFEWHEWLGEDDWLVIISSDKHTLSIWNTRTWELIHEVTFPYAISHYELDHERGWITVNYSDCIDDTCNHTLIIHDLLVDRTLIQTWVDKPLLIEAHYLNDTHLLLRDIPVDSYRSEPSMFYLLDMATGTWLLETSAYGDSGRPSPDGASILMFAEEGTRLYDLATGDMQLEFSIPPGPHVVMDWSPDGQTIVFGMSYGYNDRGYVYSAVTGEELFFQSN